MPDASPFGHTLGFTDVLVDKSVLLSVLLGVSNGFSNITALASILTRGLRLDLFGDLQPMSVFL